MALSVPTCRVSKFASLTGPKVTGGGASVTSGNSPLTVAVVVPSYTLLSPKPNTQALASSVPPPVKLLA